MKATPDNLARKVRREVGHIVRLDEVVQVVVAQLEGEHEQPIFEEDPDSDEVHNLFVASLVEDGRFLDRARPIDIDLLEHVPIAGFRRAIRYVNQPAHPPQPRSPSPI